MSLPESLAINAMAASLAPSFIVTMWEIDARMIPGGGLMRFCELTDAWNQAIVWQGETYVPVPVEAKGFEVRGQGAPPRPRLLFGNVGGQFSRLCIALRDMVGAKVSRKRTMAKYLDGMPSASPSTHFPDDVFHIEQKTTENRIGVEFELGTSMDVDDVELPKRQVISGTCIWAYRDENCGYATNTAIASVDGTPFGEPKVYKGAWLVASLYETGDIVFLLLGDGRKQFYRLASHSGSGITGLDTRPGTDARWVADECGKHTADCLLRHGAVPNGLPFGGWPAANRQGG